MSERKTPMDFTIWRLNNALKGQAMLCKDSNYLTPEEKLAEMEAIENMVKYINGYYKNIQVLEQAKQKPQTEIERDD